MKGGAMSCCDCDCDCGSGCCLGRATHIDSSQAGALPGVVAVVSRDNLNVASNSFGAYVRDQQILAT